MKIWFGKILRKKFNIFSILFKILSWKFSFFENSDCFISFTFFLTVHLGKNLKKLKMRKIIILWYLCQKSSKCDFNTFNIVKFDSRLVLFSSIFQFQNTFVPKKIFSCFCNNFVKINCQNFAKTWWFWQHSWWIKHILEIIRYLHVLIYPIRFIKLSSKLVFLD